MTRDQMHNTLRYVREQLADERGTDYSGVKALDMVLEELEQEPTIGQLFSCEEVEELRKKIWKQVEQEPSGDLISRQAVIDACEQSINILEAVDRIMDLPSVEQEPCSNCCNGNQIEKAKLCQKSYLAGMEHKQEPKTGHWSHDGSHWKNRFICSECGYKLFDEPTNYCPNCGAKMVEPQESEDKE